MRNQISRLIDDPVYRHRGNPEFSEHDENGYRVSGSISRAEVLLTGSSHVYGINLPPDNTWPKRLHQSGVNLYSAAMGAWSVMQYALIARDFLNENHRVFIVGIYTGFDIYATLKHSLETTSDFSRRFLETASTGNLEGVSWAARNKRDAFLRSRTSSGVSLVEALNEARNQELADAFSVNMHGDEYWLEPDLRIATMDLRNEYINTALSMASEYLGYISDRCRANGTKLVIAILPTKENCIAHSLELDKCPAKLYELSRIEGRLVRSMFDLFSPMADVVDITPRLVDACKSGKRVFDSTPLEGHPSEEGAEVIADYMRKTLSRFL